MTRRRPFWCAAAFVASTLAAPHASATGYQEIGQDYRTRDKTEVNLAGYMRLRTEALHNLDLDRGLTPSGLPIFPVSQADPKAQTLTHADMRFRTDLSLYAPGSMVGVKARIDMLDNIALGSLPDGIPSATTTQRSPADVVRVRRAWGELLLPFGFITAGRMGTHWGLGMVANGGDCLDCDSADAADRIAFLTPLAGHIWGFAYDFSATLPLGARPAQNRTIALEPTTNVRTATFVWMRYHTDEARERRAKAAKSTLDYGAYVTHRWQENDVPSAYLPTATNVDPLLNGGSGIMSRGYTATAFDGWARLTLPFGRVEAEAAFLTATVDQPSLFPGTLFNRPAKSKQVGAALQSDFGTGPFSFGFDAGYASGDPTPGFGVVQRAGNPAPVAGDLDGAQGNPPRDNRVDNFRFHPDYRVDRILFREILGAITDAAYARPHARVQIARARSTQLTAHVAGVASTAIEKNSTPSGKAPLGVEIDPSLVFETHQFLAALDYGVLFPLAGFDNTVANLSAKPAQLIRLRLNYLF
ncbi:MAG: TIGR04551 family protein [Labilithrix sp.]|nr:TIGR04551 family protein [Labilithrix sp.]MCW5811385.1 TIGR04551 family protein [Labilithrix sp.]